MSENAPTAHELERQVAALEDTFARFRKAQASGRRRALLFPALLAAMVLAFTAATCSRIQNNFTDSAMKAAMARHADQLRPILQSEALAAFDELGPVYKAELLRTLDRVGPEVGSRAIHKIRAIPAELAPLAEKRAEAMVKRVFTRLAPEIEKSIGRVPDDRERELVADVVRQVTQDVKLRGEEIARAQTRRVEQILESFDLPPVNPNAGIGDHQRQFVHLLLLLADHELMNADDADPAPLPARPRAAATQVGLALPR